MRFLRLDAVLIAAGMAMVIVGCSGGSSSPSASGTPPTSPSASPSPNGSSTLDPQLVRIVLTSAQVTATGSPVVTQLLPGGNEVAGQVTLDACNGQFASESKRVARIQVAYVATSGPRAGRQVASNEVVRYSSGGTAEAFSELKQVAAGCPARVRFSKSDVQTNFAIQSGAAGLGAQQLTLTSLMHAPKGQNVWSAATYLFHGDLFDGVYVYGKTRARALRADRHLAKIAYQRMTSAPASGGLTI
jgi:hypothetical protein